MKKTQIITIRTDDNIKDRLQERAQKYDWSVSQTAEKIIRRHFESIDAIQLDMSEAIHEGIDISKVNHETIYELSLKKGISYDEALNYIVEYFSYLWPIE